MSFDVAIFGLGCAGAALADAATRAGLRCVVFDDRAQKYASVRNQGWLHSGALYAARNSDPSIIDLCKRGANMIVQFNTELRLNAIHNVPGLMVFHNYHEREAAIERVKACDIVARPVDRQTALLLEPILEPTRDRRTIAGGILTPDVTVNTPKLLYAMTQRARQNGCTYIPHPIDTIRATRSGAVWRILLEDETYITVSQIVLTAGALIPRIAVEIFSQQVKGSIEQCGVLSLRRRVVDRLVMMPFDASAHMNIAPFSDGVTINCGQIFRVSENIEEKWFRDVTINKISQFVPSIAAFCPIESRLYICQKFNPETKLLKAGSSCREFYHEQLANGVYVFYPGKFTQCMLAANEVAHCLTGDSSSTSVINTDEEEIIYAHPGNEPEFLLAVNGNEIIPIPLSGIVPD